MLITDSRGSSGIWSDAPAGGLTPDDLFSVDASVVSRMPFIDVLTAEISRYQPVTEESRAHTHSRGFRAWITTASPIRFAAQISGDSASAVLPQDVGWGTWQYGKRLYSGCSLDDEHSTWTVGLVTLEPAQLDVVERISEAMEAVDSLAALRANWDSYGAAEIDGGAIAAARIFLRLALVCDGSLAPPKVMGTPDGSVVLEWYGATFEASVEVFNGAFRAFVLRTTTDEVIRDLAFSPDEVGDLVATVIPFLGR